MQRILVGLLQYLVSHLREEIDESRSAKYDESRNAANIETKWERCVLAMEKWRKDVYLKHEQDGEGVVHSELICYQGYEAKSSTKGHRSITFEVYNLLINESTGMDMHSIKRKDRLTQRKKNN